ncbi:hypothetical protein [Gottfriedia acidiceleris]|uniref:hypothetical protein n=1 Tax=Gottfriedia acidiceleris TaxID=371036 RepID=UPI0013ED8502|nr:hypothetical protein [Gottfriedia acidiceleris]
MGKIQLDLNNLNQQLIIAGLAGLVEDNGCTPHEALDIHDVIKNSTFHDLCDLKKEVSK